MADRAISALPTATTLTASDLFVLSQSNQAKNTTWQTIIGYLTTALDGHGGIQSISKTGTSGLVDTYTITFADQTTQTFTVTNGKGISTITKTAGTGTNLTDTYTITYNDGTTYQFTVDNGKAISSITDKWAASSSKTLVPSTWYDSATITSTLKYLWHYQIITFNDGTTLDTDKVVVGAYGDTGQDWYVHIRWAENDPTADADMKTTPDNWIGIYSGTAETAPTSYSSYSWYEYKGEKGDTGNGITGVSLYSSSGLVDTYRVYFDDGTYTSFNVTNGAQIDRIEKTGTSGLTDTYTVYLTNGTSATTFQVTNGKGISSITEVDVTHAAGHTDVYRFNFNDGDTYSFSIYNGSNGSGSVSTVDNIPSNNQDVPLLQFGQGAPTTSTVGQLKSRYFDQVNSILYICVGIDTSGAETTYTWQGAGVTVDSALSTMSTNPVQNAVLTALLGTATLDTTAQTLTGAVNELNAGLATLENTKYDLNAGTAITSGSDLNDFTTPGTFYCSSASVSSSITNGPVTNATYKLIVERATASVRVAQTAIINSSGNARYARYYAGSSWSAWRKIAYTSDVDSAVDSLETTKVSKVGDTMTGNLTINNISPGFYAKATDVTDGTAPSENTNQVGFRVVDKNGTNIALFTDRELTNGNQGAWVGGARNGVYNSLYLLLDSSGNRVVSFSEAAPWRKALELGSSSGTLPITIGQGGTGATTAANAKANLGLGTEAQNFEVTSQTSGTQLFALRAKSLNSGGNYNNHNMALVINEGGMLLYDSTGGTTPWSLAFPIAVDKGGTGATTASAARSNLGLGSVATVDTVPISQGGTGATSEANARKNLGLCYAANDTLAITSSTVVNGYFISTSQAYFDFVVEKSMENISSISVTAMTGTLQGSNGAVEGGSNINFASGSAYTLSCTKQGNRHVRISLKKSSAMSNAVAATTACYFGTLTLKFT